jgi:hypothetical protein
MSADFGWSRFGGVSGGWSRVVCFGTSRLARVFENVLGGFFASGVIRGVSRARRAW